jgi:trans-aconitate methyltransferase
MSVPKLALTLVLVLSLTLVASSQTQAPLHTPDVIYVPTPEAVVDAMLKLAEVQKADVVYDLGCGDGRIVATAAKNYGVKAVGIDIDPQRIAEATETVKKAGVSNLVTLRNEDLFDADIKEASVVTLYLLTSLNLRLRPKLLQELKPGSRIVSQTFDMGDWQPEKTETVEGRNIYLWRVPARAAGN